jgi:hypothetical protein
VIKREKERKRLETILKIKSFLFHYHHVKIIFKKNEEEGWLMAPSEFVPTINEGTNNYKSILILH